MTHRLKKPFASRLATVILLTATMTSAMAQYVWIDDKGTKQYSDMPPPASISANRILKQPGAPASATPQTATEDAAAKPSAPTLAERNAEFRKRQQEAAEKEKKAAEQAKQAAEKAKNCERMRDYMRSLESGERISYRDKNGEKVFLTDEQRASEMRDTRQALADCNK